MSTKSIIFAFASLSLVSAAWADGVTGPFIQKRGVTEFTGTMIVRPLQPDALARRGFPPQDISRIRTSAVARIRALTVRTNPEFDTYIVKVPQGSDENAYSKQLRLTGEYEYAVPNWRCYPLAKVTPNDPRFPTQWHHKIIKSEDAWGINTGPNTITVTVVDTGTMVAHEDLVAGAVKGYNSVDRKAEVDGGDITDLNGHGTHTAGDAAAQGNNGKGLVGEGWKFKIMPVRTSNSPGGGASLDDMFDGAKWAVNHGAKVISVSYSGIDSPACQTTGAYVKSKGGLLLWSAGNDNRDLAGFSYPDVIVVGSTNEVDEKSDFSAYGKGVAVFAPGSNIWSTALGGGYLAESGTSMAAPVANGACALIWSINPLLTPNQVQQILYTTCDKIADPIKTGRGRINLFKAATASAATKYVNATFNATAVKTLVGTFKTGNLNNIVTGTGVGYQTSSSFDPYTGYSTAVELTYKITGSLDKVKSLNPLFKVSSTGGVSLIGMVYMYNVVTAKYVLVKSVSLPITGVTTTVQAPMTGGFSPYITNTGNVRAVLRVFSPIGRRGSVGGSFTSNIRFSQLKTTMSQ